MTGGDARPPSRWWVPNWDWRQGQPNGANPSNLRTPMDDGGPHPSQLTRRWTTGGLTRDNSHVDGRRGASPVTSHTSMDDGGPHPSQLTRRWTTGASPVTTHTSMDDGGPHPSQLTRRWTTGGLTRDNSHVDGRRASPPVFAARRLGKTGSIHRLCHSVILSPSSWSRSMKNPILCVAVVVMACGFAQAQYKVLYAFGTNGPNDGAGPNGGMVFDAAGNLYGTTGAGGSVGAGTVFELTPMQDGMWQETILYSFCPGGLNNGCPDGKFPVAGLTLDSQGNLYGTAPFGGAYHEGVVFELSPSQVPSGNWTEQVIWSFGAPYDGNGPKSGLVIDSAGNLYGTTESSQSEGAGLVFELSPGPNGWTESVLHIFCLNYPDCSDGAQPIAGVTLDKAGNLYGTTMFGGTSKKVSGWGVVYELSPTKNGWTETVLKAFTKGTGGRSSAGITIDPAGHLYGGVTEGGPHKCGGYFRLNKFAGFQLSGGNGCAPQSDLLYSSGTLFGSTGQGGANSQGVLFKLSKQGSQVTQTILYNFCQQPNCADGSWPNGSLTISNGQLYGAAAFGGLNDGGVIFQITP